MTNGRKFTLMVGLAISVVSLWLVLVVGRAHVAALFAEGYPAATYSSAFHVVEVSGRPASLARPARFQTLSPPLQSIFNESGGRALLVIHKGVPVLEHYAPGYDATTKFNSFSLVKSLVGALTLRAIDEGQLSLDANLGDAVASKQSASPGSERSIDTVTIRELLEMRSGIHYAAFGGLLHHSMASPKDKDFERTIFNPFGPMARLHFGNLETVRENLVTLRKRNTAPPFNYQNINTALLGRAISDSTGRPLSQLLSEKIWKPSGATAAQWRTYPADGTATPYCCLFATARDWARIGFFLLRNGTQENAFLTPSSWRAFVMPDLEASEVEKGAYGFHIRHDILNRPGEPLQGRFAYMMGQGGQAVYLMPSHDLVVVRFGERHQKLHSTLYEVWRQINSLKGAN